MLPNIAVERWSNSGELTPAVRVGSALSCLASGACLALVDASWPQAPPALVMRLSGHLSSICAARERELIEKHRRHGQRACSALAGQLPPRWGESFSRYVAHILSPLPPAAPATHFPWHQAQMPNCPRRIQTEETVSRYNPLLHKNQSSSQFNSQIRSKLGHCFCCSASLSRLYAVLLRNQNLA